MKNRNIMILIVMTFSLGIMLLFGSSYSLIINEKENENIIKIPKFDTFYQKYLKISIINNKVSENNFEIVNESENDIKYRIDILPSSNSKTNKMINFSYTLNDNQTKNGNLGDNSNIIHNHLLGKNMKDSYKLNFVFNDIYDSLNPFETILNIYVYKDTVKFASETLENMESNDLEMIDNELRFTSSNPNNYVWFNCDNNYKSGNEHCEKWRIIGSFNQQIENSNEVFRSIKIMKSTSDDEIWFNKDELNGKFDNSFANSYLNGSYYEKMSDDTKKLILKARFNIGDVTIFNYKDSVKDEKNDYYYAYIGLINPSDYLAIRNNWMIFDKKILLLNKCNNYVNVINNGITFDLASDEYNYIPVVYLKEEVSFINGNGSFESPFELNIIN